MVTELGGGADVWVASANGYYVIDVVRLHPTIIAAYLK